MDQPTFEEVENKYRMGKIRIHIPDDAEDRLARERAKLKEMRQEVEWAKAEAQKKKAELDNSARILTILDGVSEKFKGVRKEFNDELTAARAEKNAAEQRYQTLNADVARLRERFPGKRNSLGATATRGALADLDDLIDEVTGPTGLRSRLETANSARSSLEQRVQGLQGQVEALGKKAKSHDAVVKENRELKERLRSFGLEPEDMTQLRTKIAALESDVLKEEERYSGLQTKAEGARAKIAALEPVIEDLKAEETALEDQISAKKRRVSNLESETDGLRMKIATLESNINDLRRNIALLEHKAKQEQEQKSTLEHVNQDLRTSIAALESKTESSKDENASFDSEFDQISTKEELAAFKAEVDGPGGLRVKAEAWSNLVAYFRREGKPYAEKSSLEDQLAALERDHHEFSNFAAVIAQNLARCLINTGVDGAKEAAEAFSDKVTTKRAEELSSAIARSYGLHVQSVRGLKGLADSLTVERKKLLQELHDWRGLARRLAARLRAQDGSIDELMEYIKNRP